MEVKIVEMTDAGASTDLTSSATAIADTAGGWVTYKVTTDVTPAIGDRTYCLVARLNGATSGTIRFGSMTLLHIA